MRWLTELQNRTFGASFVMLCGGRRYHVHGLDNIKDVTPEDRVILVANHRSFFDFYVIMTINFWYTAIGGRLLFPVRSTFFYERPIGALINFCMSGMTMFPPIMRSGKKRAFNRFSLDRMEEELTVPGTVIGFHPEGTRSKGDNPYALLRPQRGVGEVVRRVGPGVKVVPIFAVGMGSNLLREALWNLFQPKAHPIDLVYGKPIDFGDLLQQADDRHTHRAIALRCMDAIAELAAFQHEHGVLKLGVPLPGDGAREEASG